MQINEVLRGRPVCGPESAGKQIYLSPRKDRPRRLVPNASTVEQWNGGLSMASAGYETIERNPKYQELVRTRSSFGVTVMVVLSPAVWEVTMGNPKGSAPFPIDNPALFSMTIAFVGIWL